MTPAQRALSLSLLALTLLLASGLWFNRSLPPLAATLTAATLTVAATRASLFELPTLRRLAVAALALAALAYATARYAVGLPPNHSVFVGNALALPALTLLWTTRPPLDLTPRTFYALASLATVLGGALHLCLFAALPEGIATPDSAGYTAPARAWLDHGAWPCSPHRTLGYCTFYGAFYDLANDASLVHLAQVALGWCTAIGAACFVARRTAWPYLCGLCVYTLLWVSPTLSLYAHFVLTETPYIALALLGSAALIRGLETRTLRWSVLAGTAIGLAVLVRPAGLALLPAASALLLWELRRTPLRLLTHHLAVFGACAIPIGAQLLINKLVHGFVGLTALSGLTLLGVSAHLVEPQEGPTRAHREAIRAAVVETGFEDDIDFMGKLLWTPEIGLQTRLATIEGGDAAAVNRVAGSLAREAILAHPLTYARDTVYRGRLYLLPAYRYEPLQTVEHYRPQTVRDGAWALGASLAGLLSVYTYGLLALLPVLVVVAWRRRPQVEVLGLLLPAVASLLLTAMVKTGTLETRFAIPSLVWVVLALFLALGPPKTEDDA